MRSPCLSKLMFYSQSASMIISGSCLHIMHLVTASKVCDFVIIIRISSKMHVQAVFWDACVPNTAVHISYAAQGTTCACGSMIAFLSFSVNTAFRSSLHITMHFTVKELILRACKPLIHTKYGVFRECKVFWTNLAAIEAVSGSSPLSCSV